MGCKLKIKNIDNKDMIETMKVAGLYSAKKNGKISCALSKSINPMLPTLSNGTNKQRKKML